MNKTKIKILTFISFMFIGINQVSAQEKETIFTDDIKTIVDAENPNLINIKVNWLLLPKKARENFEFYKLSHSTNNPDVKYPESYIWYTNDIKETIAKGNFTDYSPNNNGINYYRTCIVSDKIYCQKKATILSLNKKEETTKTLEISSTKTQDSRTSSIKYDASDTLSPISGANISSNATISIDTVDYVYLIIILSVIAFIIWLRKTNKFDKSEPTNKQEAITNNENVLQILKHEDNYIVEYNGIYNKGIKVLEKNKENISSALYNYVNSVNKLKVRGCDIYEELKNLDIKIPDLKESGSTIYRLYLPENIRESLKMQNQNEALVIKTDEQEVPWEIMHNGENFLSLKYPIGRKIMTRESIRKNSKQTNKLAKILFITNPSSDLEGSEKETSEIIKKLGKKAEITLVSEKEATSTKIFSLLGQDCWDIIHYSGHAYFDKENPEQSGLILSDSIVSASEIKRVLNGNPLIFLNACSSGRNDEKNYEETGEDTVGIASNFIIGGAKGVISTLWPITDNAASSFAIDFYENFLASQNIGNALLKAKKETYVKFPNDISWASFIYYGDLNLKIK